jgi:hypothetical protein
MEGSMTEEFSSSSSMISFSVEPRPRIFYNSCFVVCFGAIFEVFWDEFLELSLLLSLLGRMTIRGTGEIGISFQSGL